MVRRVLVHLALTVTCLVGATVSHAADIWVTRYDDPVPNGCSPTDCSLREAVISTEGSGLVANRIFLSAGTYELTRAGANEDAAATGDLDIFNRRLEIIGPGATMTTIDANGLDRVFHLSDAGVIGSIIRLAGLELVGGAVNGPGSAIIATRVDLTIDACEITGNTDLQGGDDEVVYGSLFSELLVLGSTIGGNAGGGIGVTQASASIHNSTIADDDFQGITAQGGATVLGVHSTITGASDGIPEIEASGDGSVVQLLNCFVLGSCLATSSGDVQTLGGNVESPGDSCTFGASDKVDVTLPGLGSLALNGGPTRTRLPSVQSAGLGAAVDAWCFEVDQRGAVRTGTSCESGSVERSSTRVETPLFYDGFDQRSAKAWDATKP